MNAALRPLRWPRCWRALWWLMLAAVVLVCVVPAPPDPLAVRHADKLYHLAGYAVLAGFAVQLFRPPALWWRLAGLLLLGVGLEALQALLPWRSADAQDALANALGVLLGTALASTPLAHALQWLEQRLPGR